MINATLCQYHKKVNDIEQLSQSAISHDNVLFRCANSMLENNDKCLSHDIKSDSDKDDPDSSCSGIKSELEDNHEEDMSNKEVKSKSDYERK